MATYAQLVGLLGKPVDDPQVKKVVGDAKIDKDYIISKARGFELHLNRPPGASNKTPKLVTLVCLHADGHEKFKGFVGLPKPFTFGLDRAALIELAPDRAWKLGSETEPDDPEAFRFYWDRDGNEFSAELSHRTGELQMYTVEPPEDSLGGRDISTHPLHFEAAPSDAPANAGITGMALLLAWATEKFGASDKHGTLDRKIGPRTHFLATCKNTLTTLDVDKQLGGFLWGYTNRMFLGEDARKPAARTIKKLLNLHREDEIAFSDDYLATFKDLANPYYVPDRWDAVDRIAPVLDARWADYQKTKFKKAPDLKLYEKAAKARDAVKVTPEKQAAAVQTGTIDAGELIACIGKPMTDKTVKDVLTRAGMPIGKKIDEQANPSLGVSYLGDKEKGKMRVGDATFYAAKQKRHIRGLGREVIFEGYKGALPLGVKLGDKRAAVHKRFGKPASKGDDTDIWFPRVDRRIAATFSKNGVLVQLNIGFPAEWLDPPEPPYGPEGLF